MKVLLTRQKEDCVRTAKHLEAAGYETVIFPLIAKVRLENRAQNIAPDFLVFTSAIAVDCVGADLSPVWKELPVYAVGPRTASMLVDCGYKNIRQGKGSARHLADRILAEQQSKAASGIYYCAKERAFDMEEALSGLNITLECCVVYEIAKLKVDKAAFSQALSEVAGGVSLLFSPLSAQAFMELVRECEVEKLLEPIHFAVISEKTSQAVDVRLVKSLHIAKSPNEQSLIEVIKQIQKA